MKYFIQLALYWLYNSIGIVSTVILWNVICQSLFPGNQWAQVVSFPISTFCVWLAMGNMPKRK